MDELLFERVKQLKEIDERLERIKPIDFGSCESIRHLRDDIALMIQHAEAEHAAF